MRRRRGARGWALLLVGVFALPLLSGCGGDGTGPRGDPDPPRAVERSPGDGAEGVDVLAAVTVRFDQPLDGSSVAEAVALRSGGHPLGGTTTLEGDRTLRFVPRSPLDFGEAYDVEVGAGLRDRDGDAPDAPIRWRFRTEGRALPAADPARLRGHVEVLAADSLGGRGSGTEDARRAARYLASVFEGHGLARLRGVREQPFTEPRPSDGAPVASRNVLAVVPGTGALVDEWVVVGAHYDHLGTEAGPDGEPVVYNGADDNASGTSVTLELARLWAEWAGSGGMAGQPRRSVLFAGWGAEEVGLLGSCHFTASDLLPLADVVAVLNLDMVGRLRGNRAEALGMESSAAWAGLLDDADRAGVAFDGSTVCQSCSDHACFRREGVPYLWFFTGWHEDYHGPGDDADRLEYGGMVRLADVGARVLARLAVSLEPPPFRGH